MTEPGPAEPQPTDPQPVEPQPTEPTGAELDRLIIDASRTYIALQRARPRNPQAVADAKAELDELLALRDASGG